MGYKVLVTLDLPDATEDQRKNFYEVLSTEKWKKIPNLTTAWKASFKDDVTRNSAISIMEGDLLIISAKVSHRFGKVSHLQKLGGFVCKYTDFI